MHQLTLALHRQGHEVSGSDDEINDPARANLAAAGLLPEPGWHPERITPQLDAVVLGMHAKAGNPELEAAQQLGLRVYSFPAYVYETAKNKQRVVVAGSHGKTTITSMIMHVLQAAGKDFDYLVGAAVPGFSNAVKLTDAPVIVLEGDEYPASAVEPKPKIFFYHPQVSVLSGIEWDHVNVFPTYENYVDQFRHYLQGLEMGAQLFYNETDEAVVKLVAEAATHLKAVPYGMPQYRYQDGRASVQTAAGPVELQVFGSHNFLNMEAARKVCATLGVDEPAFYKTMQTFTGAARRLEKIAETDTLVAFRDFAHAPSKLRATLAAVREAYPERRLVCVYELHTYSSLSEGFLKHYAHTMDPADVAIVYFSRHALELKGLPPLQRDEVSKAFATPGLEVMDDKDQLVQRLEALQRNTSDQTCLLLMSSGTFDGARLLMP